MPDLESIKQLREQTGAGMMDAKAALLEAKGDMAKAKELLRVKGQATASRKAARATGAGLIEAYVHQGRIGAILELKTETDFVARTDDFKQLAKDLVMQVAAAQPSYVSPEQVPASALRREEKAIKAELSAQGKPANVIRNALPGKMEKFYEQHCLLKQPFFRDPEMSVQSRIQETIGKLGENIVVARFARLELGVENEA